MNFVKQDLLDYLCQEQEDQYVLFSNYLPEKHPDFILTIENYDLNYSDVVKISEMEDRTIIKQSQKTDSDLIYKIYQRKTKRLKPAKLDDELESFLKPVENEVEEEYEYFS